MMDLWMQKRNDFVLGNAIKTQSETQSLRFTKCNLCVSESVVSIDNIELLRFRKRKCCVFRNAIKTQSETQSLRFTKRNQNAINIFLTELY